MTEDTINSIHPPLRKKSSQVKTVALKQIHVEQHSKLQHKHQQHDNDILEDICNFAKRRSQIEKDYAQALLKLSTSLQARKDPFQIPELGEENGKEFKTMASVWHTVLEETEKIAKVRMIAADTYMQDVSEPIKALKTWKNQHMKKLLDQFATIQGELTQSVRELNKAKKIYTDEEKIAHDARQKSSEAEEKVKRRSTGLFSSLASLQKTSAKLTNRKEACETRSISTRNEYLLGLAATNAQLTRFYSMDMPELMKAMDGDMYEKVQGAFMTLSKTELECCGLTQECFSKVLCDSTMISREYNHQCLLNHSLVFTDLLQYSFERYENDPSTEVMEDPKGEHTLTMEADKWARKVTKENKVINEYSQILHDLLTGTYTGEKKVTDPTSPEGETKDGKQPEVEVSVDSCKELIRKAETAKLKASARLELLKAAGVDVEGCLTKAGLDTLSPTDLEEDSSRTSVGGWNRPHSSGGQSECSGNDTTYHSYNCDEVFSDEAFDPHSPNSTNDLNSPAYVASTSTEATSSVGQLSSSCRPESSNGQLALALYDFQGGNSDELSIVAEEYLTIVGPGDAPGWVKVINSRGDEGLVPESYTHLLNDDGQPIKSGDSLNGNVWGDSVTGPSSNDTPADDTKFSFSESTAPTAEANSCDVTNRNTNFSSTDYEVQDVIKPPTNGMLAGEWVRAIYDYDATSAEELSFQEGQLIRLISRDEEFGDGWWKGEMDGRVGAFPSLVVEELTDELGLDVVSPMRPGPPSFAPPVGPDVTDDGNGQPTPPPVTVTLPTPNDEQTQSVVEASGEDTSTEAGTGDDDTITVPRPNEISDLDSDHIDSPSQSLPSSPLHDEVKTMTARRQSLDPGTTAVDMSTMAEDRVIASNELRRRSVDACGDVTPDIVLTKPSEPLQNLVEIESSDA